MQLRTTIYPVLAVTAGLATIALMRRANLGTLTSVLAVALIGGFALFFWRLHLRSAYRDLPLISDDIFLESFGSEIGLPGEQLVTARKWIARRLSIPPERLAPDQELGILAKRLDFLGNAYIGLNEVEEALADLYEKAGEKVRSAGGLTVASAASELVRLGLIR